MGGENTWNIMRAHPYCNKLRNTELYIPSLNYEYKLYRYFTNEQMLFLIRAIYYYQHRLRRHFEWCIENNYISREHYKIQLENLDTLTTLVDNKVIDVFNYKFNET